MRLVGLTLCLLASSLGARAEAAEERIAVLENQVKTLQEALRNQSRSLVNEVITPASMATETNAVAEVEAVVRESGSQPR
jgi:hypothetical protein